MDLNNLVPKNKTRDDIVELQESRRETERDQFEDDSDESGDYDKEMFNNTGDSANSLPETVDHAPNMMMHNKTANHVPNMMNETADETGTALPDITMETPVVIELEHVPCQNSCPCLNILKEIQEGIITLLFAYIFFFNFLNF